ncbi:MAG: hypothetical protein R3F34_07880 [Planctomycetota bacterium]
MTRRLVVPAIALVFAASAPTFVGVASAQQPPPQQQEEPAEPEPKILDEAQTRGLVGQFERAEHWTVQGLVIVSLGVSWHPSAASVFIAAISGKSPELRAFAVEVLAKANDDCLLSTATPELVEALIEDGLKVRDDHYSDTVLGILKRIFPEEDAKNRPQWQGRWHKLRETYEPTKWVAPPRKDEGPGRTVAGVVGRAMDLRESGLEICFCIDATGSMDPLLAATAGAAEQVATLLEGFAPDLRVGAVFYKDMEDLSGGAKVIEELTDKTDKVFKKIGNLSAGGGGDIPEAVERGLEIALDPDEMGWKSTTNKLVIVMGDAPPHPPDVPRAEELARKAHETPLEAGKSGRRRPVTGDSKGEPRPFVVSCIGCGQGAVPGETESAFKRIAEAGGGGYAALRLGPAVGKPDKDDKKLGASTREIVGQVLSMSFGERFRDDMQVFLGIYFAYYERGFFD